jgi:WD40 repeat protein
MENFIGKRRFNISVFLCDFFPKDIAKLISNYDYYLEGKNYIFNDRYPNDKEYSNINITRNISVLPDGNIVAGTNEPSIKIWNVQTGYCVNIFNSFVDHFSGIDCIKVLHDGRIITCLNDSIII